MAVSAKFSADFTSFTQAVQKAEVSLKSFETGAGKVEKSLSKMGDSFSGVKLIQEANLLVKAIGGIEGATKLTETEQKKVNATLTEALAKYKALGMEAPKAMMDLAKATKQADTEMDSVSKGVSFLKSSFSQFTAANLAASAIQSVTSEVGRFIQQGAKLQGVETSFQRLSSGAKENSAVMLGALQEGTRGLVSNMELMTQANKAMLLGLPVTSDAMGELAKTATTLGKAMGQDATKSLDDLITALGRSSPMILDNLGLTVKVGEANEKYAKTLGKTAEELTEHEKKMAFYVAAMEAARVKTSQLGEQTLTLGERMTKVWTTIENGVTLIASDMNVVLGKATQSWGDFFDFISDSARFKSFEEQAKKLRPATEAMLPFADPSALARQSQAYQDELDQAKKDYEKLKADQKKAEEEFTRNVRENAKMRAEDTRQSYEDTRIALKSYYDMVLKANSGITAGVEGLTFRKSTEASVLDGLAGQWLEYGNVINGVNGKIKIGIDTLPGFGYSAEQIGGKFLKSKKDTEAWRAEVDKLAQAMTQLSQTAGNSLVSALATMVNGINVGAKAMESLKEGFDKLTSGGGIKSILSGFTGIVSGIGGIVSAAQAAISIGKALFDVFDRDKGRDLVEDFVEQFGGFDGIQKIFAEMGEEGHRLWVMLTQGVGRNNPDQARKAIEEVTRAIEEFKRAAANIPPINFQVNGIEPTGDRGGLDGDAAALANAGSAGDIVIQNQMMLDGRVVAESVTRHQSAARSNRQLVGAA